jgi:hypothetical protein
MKLSAWLLVVSFVSLPLFAESAFFRQSSGSTSSLYGGRLYSDQATYWAEYAPYRNHSLDSDPAEGVYLSGGGGVPGWDSEGYGENPYRAPQQPPYAEQLPDTRYLADSPFVGDARYHRADVTQSHWASEWDQGYPDLWASTNDPAASARGGYDFRSPHEVRDWNASSWRDSYRFRPLTDLERRRIDTATGWRPRPRSPYPFVEGIRQVDVSPPVETYGYQSDGGWLDRYYGRP